MFKQLSIAIIAVGAAMIFWTDADAGCATIGGRQVCASYITGGSEVGLVTGTGFGNNSNACPAVESSQEGAGEGPALTSFPQTTSIEITQKLAGTVGSNCGLGRSKNDECQIRGVVFCGSAPAASPGALTTQRGDDDNNNSNGRSVTTSGPLTVSAPGFAQSDGSGRNFAAFRFQLDSSEQNRLCGNKPFITFIAREGFFETCVDDGTGTPSISSDRNEDGPVCVRERCTVNLDGLKPDDARVYQCKRL